MTWLFLLFALACGWLSYNLYHPVYRHTYGASVSFVFGLLAGELAPHVIALQVLITALFAAFGALSGLAGTVGLVVMLAAWTAMAVHYGSSMRLPGLLRNSLERDLGPNYRDAITQPPRNTIDRRALLRPLASMIKSTEYHPEVECLKNIIFHRSNGLNLKLDIRRPRSVTSPRPVLLQIHGGAWTYKLGSKDRQALPLMNHLAAHGWVCVAISYRLSPLATFPDHIIDCKRALAWVKTHIAEYGGDPDFILATGGSAGGHLSALLALTPNQTQWQPGFEGADTRVQGCIPFYGIYDFCNSNRQQLNNGLESWLERMVIKSPTQESPDTYRLASPIVHVHPQAPPFFVIQGDTDTLVPAAEGRHFVDALRAVSKQPVVYAEIPRAQHAFDLFPSLRTQRVVHAVEEFADWVYAGHRRETGAGTRT
ncbi:alpha/beta hydrolase [Exilibacterium tricleocarpae]|uniref:Alpha/beta hydrolase n=1 Tax=Exilibacterium tricleocarpae TaxID=2591008 RepID=A0A545U5J5_9GAMM|nr:alpha/beta hydrolase [Exilibacterium tricleocarpae]TQV84673.1 alpha/beta hydrolase [Exilibacterium tricleocarpae]